MQIPVNIEQLLSATSIEGAHIEYKKGWNPDAIYRSVCAFANDFDNSGGGYIIVGVQEQNGRPIRPVKGLDLNEIKPIEKDMIGFNNLIQPAYYPHTSLEDVDGKKVLVIWIPGGANRPYKVPDEVTAKHKRYNYYIRYNSSSIIAKGEFEKELLDLTEGKATGIPTIIKEMKANGSPAASFETDDARTYFIVTFPIHPVFVQNEPQSEPQNTVSVTLRQNEILRLIKADGRITRAQMSGQLKISEATIKREIKYLREQGILRYDGPARSGKWIVNTDIDIAVHL